MQYFPTSLSPYQVKFFPDYVLNRELCILRMKIYEFIISQKKGGFDLRSQTDESGQFSYKTMDEKIMEQIRKELHDLGWETKLSFGGTTMYIFDPKNIPEEVKNLPPEESMETIE